MPTSTITDSERQRETLGKQKARFRLVISINMTLLDRTQVREQVY